MSAVAIDDLIERIILDEKDGQTFGLAPLRIMTREPRSRIEWRERYLRWCALLSRVWIDSYERRLPPLEWRTHRHIDALVERTWEVQQRISDLVLRVDMASSGGCMREWHAAVEEVAQLTTEECEAELAKLPLAP